MWDNRELISFKQRDKWKQSHYYYYKVITNTVEYKVSDVYWRRKSQNSETNLMAANPWRDWKSMSDNSEVPRKKL